MTLVRTELDVALAAPKASDSAERSFLAASALVFIAGAGATIRWCDSSCCASVPMPGGWTLCTAWTRGAGESWPGAALSFLAMWTAMMIAMMTPCLVPMLREHRRASSGAGVARVHASSAIASAGYFAIWILLGVVVYPIGAGISLAELHWPLIARCVPIAAGAALAIGGVVQCTRWKLYQLTKCRRAACCAHLEPASARRAPARAPLEPTVAPLEPTVARLEAANAPREPMGVPLEPAAARFEPAAARFESTNKRHESMGAHVERVGAPLGAAEAHLERAHARSSWRHGLALGAHCVQCCSGFMLMLLALGVMDLRAMTVIAAAMAAERILPNPIRAARAFGVLAIGAGAFAVARAVLAT